MKYPAALIIFLFTIATIVGCSMTPEKSIKTESEYGQEDKALEKDSITIAFSQSGSHSQRKTTQNNSLISECEERGYTLIFRNAGDSTEVQLQDILALIAEMPDYLVVVPREYQGLEDGIAAARAVQIPVICTDGRVFGEPGEDYDALITSNFYDQGRLCAEALLDEFGRRTCNVAILTGTEGSSATRDCTAGFEEAVRSRININITTIAAGNNNRSVAQATMESLFKKYGALSINAIFAQGDENAMGAIEALKAVGLVPGKDVRIFNCGGSQEIIKAILTNQIVMTAGQSPEFGETVLDTIENLAAGHDVEPLIWLDNSSVIDLLNAREALGTAY